MSALAAGGHRNLAEETDARAAARAHAVDAAQVPRLAGRRTRFLFTARDDGDEVRPLGADLEHVLLHGHAAAPDLEDDALVARFADDGIPGAGARGGAGEWPGERPRAG